MYLNHFGLDEPPFRITPHTDFFFAGANRGATLEALLYAITHDEGIVKVSGEVGSGKTMLCRVLMERLPAHVETILLSNPSLSREEILYAIADELDIDVGERAPAGAAAHAAGAPDHALRREPARGGADRRSARHAAGNAGADPPAVQPRDPASSKLLQIVLFGQPELDEHLTLPHMRQLKERITHSFRLEPLLRSDVEAYLDFRMRAAGYRGPNVFAAGGGAPHRQGLGGPDPARQHPRRQVPARRLRRQPARHHRQARRARHPRLQRPDVAKVDVSHLVDDAHAALAELGQHLVLAPHHGPDLKFGAQ